MEIELLELENFQCYESLSLPLRDRGLVLIEGENQDQGGSNGAGKSTIFDGIHWTCYGVTSRYGTRSSYVVREDVHHNPVGNTRGYLKIHSGDNIIEISRFYDHQQFKRKLFLIVNGEDITASSNSETQQRIDEILRIDEQAFSSVIMFPQGVRGFASLNDADQKLVLERVMNLERFSEAHERTLAKLKLFTQHASTMRTKISIIESRLIDERASIAALQHKQNTFEIEKRERVNSFETNIKRLDANKPQLDPGVQDELKRIREKQSSFTNAISISENALTLLKTLNGRKQELSNSLAVTENRIRRDLSPVEVDFTDGEAVSQNISRIFAGVSKINAEIGYFNGKISHYEEIKHRRDATVECSQCFQPLSEIAKEKMFGSVDAKLAELAEQKNRLDLILKSLEDELPLWQERQAKLKLVDEYDDNLALIQRASEIQSSLDSVVAEIESAEKIREEAVASVTQANSLEQRARYLETILVDQRMAIQNWERTREQTVKDLVAAQKLESPYAELLIPQTAKMKAVEKDLAQVRATYDVYEKERELLDFWAEGFSNRGVKSLILDTVLPFLSERSNFYMTHLTGGSSQIQFSATTELKSGETRDKLNITVQYAYGGSSYNATSGGEKQRADIAIIFALGDLAAMRAVSPINFRLLDEPFDGLDALGKEAVVEILKSFVVPRSGTVLVMSHDEGMKTLFDKRIMVVKKNGVAKVYDE